MEYIRAPSKAAAVYSIYFYTAADRNIQADAVVLDLKLSEGKNEWAQKVTVSLVNCMNGDLLLSEQINVRDRVYIYANDGEQCREVFRGYVWDKTYQNKRKKVIRLICYDNLIYLQKTEDCHYFTPGKSTSDIITELCNKFGIEAKYNYLSITHKKLPLSGKLMDNIEKALDKVKKNTGIKYVIQSREDIVYFEQYGYNAVSYVYEIKRGENAVSTTSNVTMDEVITKIIFAGKAYDSGEIPVKDTLEGNTAQWGTIQKIIRDDSENSNKDNDRDKIFENAHDEGQYILDEQGDPKVTFQIEAINNPWIRKGELIKAAAGDMAFRYIVTSITHNAVSKLMSLDLELADESKLPQSADTSVSGYNPDSGRAVDLSNAPIYTSSDAASPATYLTGTYYIYDGKEILGRYRICGSVDEVGRKPINQNVTGWLPKEYI